MKTITNLSENWTTKEEYLQFVQEWKALYKAVSAHIRGERRDRRVRASLAARGGVSLRFPGETEEKLDLRRSERSKSFSTISTVLGGHVWDLSSEATSLLVLRARSKVRAGEARAVALAEKVGA